MKKIKSAERAYTLSIAMIKDLNKEGLIEIINSIDNEQIRNEKLKLINNIPVEHPFKDSYCYGAFTMNGLLM
ncbi:MAG: hypothetical protein E6538_15895 [Paeniclostridium sordellii]|nr:hypothetical protein [Paeniclostridium sordellii]